MAADYGDVYKRQAVSYQVMATAKDSIHVLAVAMPKETLAEYEAMVREAGFEPGAVLPSTLAGLAGLVEGDAPTLVVNAGREAVTTAIVKGGVLLLHRTVDLGATLEIDTAETIMQPGGIEIAAATAVLMPETVAVASEIAQAVSCLLYTSRCV